MRVNLNGLRKRFGKSVALRDVTLEIQPGLVVAVLGLNGAGKSTLLRSMAGVAAPDGGTILYDGQPFQRERLDLRKRLLFTPEIPLVFGGKTALRNVAVFVHSYERDAAGHEEEIAAFMEEAGIISLARRLAGGFSRGQIWKLALTCAAAVRPELWLVDEPFASGMDVVGLAAFKRLARRLADAGGIVLYTTQLVNMAADFSDRICLLDNGEVRLWETTVEVKARLTAAGGDAAELFRGLQEETS